MTNNTNQKRQPKGTSDGGKFAPDVNAESTVLLAPDIDLTQPVKTTEDAVAWCEGELEKTTRDHEAMVSVGKSLDPDALDLRDYMDELRDQLVDHQRDLIAELRAGSASDLHGSATTRLQGLTSCAYAVDEAIDTLTRWDGGSGSDPADVLAHLIDVREEIFAAANPELVEQWRGIEAKVREYENDPDSSPLDDDGYEVARDERETAFQKIYEEAFAS